MIGFIGAGNMGKAIINGIINSAENFKINICDINEKTLSEFESKVNMVSTNPEDIIKDSEYIFLAIKPYQYDDFLTKYKDLLQNKIVISIAAGISEQFMFRFTNKFVLTMPNTPAMVNDGITCVLKNNQLTEEEFNVIKKIFECTGKVYFVEKEEDINTFITLSGSSPAYFGVFLEAMVDFGVSKGLDSKLAKEIVILAMRGSSNWYLNSEDTLRDQLLKVCSPNGTTIQAVDNFDKSDFSEIIKMSMKLCYDRALMIKKENDKNE